METRGSAARIFVGIDGGASGTRALAVDRDGRRIGEGGAGPSSLTLGVDMAWREIRAAIAAAGVPAAEWHDTALACGLAGARNPAARAAFGAASPGFARLLLCSDGHATVLGAHGGAPGAAVAVGTGSVGNALHADGGTREVGGWGFPVGDEGSGAWLGRAALAETLHLLDGRPVDPPGGSALHRAIRALCGPDAANFLQWLYPAPSTKYASLAPVVIGHAASGDSAARRLLAEAGRAIDALACALDPEGALPLVLAGGLARALRPWIDPGLAARLVPPQGDARDGALLLARGLAPAERLPEVRMDPAAVP
jgi:glucosamine kinase